MWHFRVRDPVASSQSGRQRAYKYYWSATGNDLAGPEDLRARGTIAAQCRWPSSVTGSAFLLYKGATQRGSNSGTRDPFCANAHSSHLQTAEFVSATPRCFER